MQLTQQTDYALRVLMYAAANRERRVNITEIADTYQISRSHLTKVIAKLTKTGYLISVRGHNGGLYLAKTPNEINIGKIVREFEPLLLVECMTKNNECVITKGCKLKCFFAKAIENFLTTLDQYYLADLIQDNWLIELSSKNLK